MKRQALTLALLTLGAVASAQTPALDDLYIHVGYAGTPPTNSYPITRLIDLNKDGKYDNTKELFAFQKKFFSVKTGYSFITSLTSTIEGGRLVFYSTDSGGSKKGECFVIRSCDINGNGVIDDKETVKWADMGQPKTYGFAPDGVAFMKDSKGRHVAIVACSSGGLSGLHWRADLNGDGDALDANESKIWVDGTTKTTVKGKTGTVTLQMTDADKIISSPLGGVIAWNTGFYKSIKDDSYCFFSFKEDAQGKVVAKNFLNTSALNKLPQNVDFASKAIIDLDLVRKGQTKSDFCDLHQMAYTPKGATGNSAFYFATAYGSTRSYGDLNAAGQKVSGLIFRCFDINNDGDYNDKSEVNVFFNGTGANVTGGVIAKTVKPASWYDGIVGGQNKLCEFIQGLTVVGDTVYVVYQGTATSQKAILAMRDTNHNFVIDTGEVWQLTYFISPFPPVYGSKYGPYINGIYALPNDISVPPQPAGVEGYGKGCPGSNGYWPSIWTKGGTPAIGNGKFEMVVSRGPANKFGLMILGHSNTNWPGVGKLPLDLTFAGMKGCFLNTNVLMTMPAPLNVKGTGAAKLPIPSTPALKGAVLYDQFFVMDPGVNKLGLTSSMGVKVTIQ